MWSALPVLGAITDNRADAAGKQGRPRALIGTCCSQRSFSIPISWAQATLDGIDALLLPGGHRARGMRSYIDSDILHRLVVDAFARGMIVAAICHGVLLAARSIDPSTGRSVLYGRKTTALTWAMERLRLAPDAGSPGSGIRTITGPIPRNPASPAGTCLCSRKLFVHLKIRRISVTSCADRRTGGSRPSGMVRDTATDPRPAFVVDDGSYVSARWPGDTHTFATVLSQKLDSAC